MPSDRSAGRLALLRRGRTTGRRGCRGRSGRRFAAMQAPATRRGSRLRRCRSPVNSRPITPARVDVDRVEPGAYATHDAEVGQRRDDTRRDRRVLQQDAGAPLAASITATRAHCASFRSRARREDFALEVDVGIIVIGVQDLHEVRGCVAIVGPAERDGERYAATRPASSVWRRTTGAPRDSCAPRAAQHTIPAREDDEPRTPMNTTLRTTIAGSLPKPGWLAEARGAVGRTLEAGRPGPRGRQARRRTAGAARQGAGRHRHRVRRRADAPPLRHHVHRRTRRCGLRAQANGPDPQSLRRGRAGGRRCRRAPASDLRRRRRVPAGADHETRQIHQPGP